MYIYNITTNVDKSIHREWLIWVQESNIPKILQTGYFSKALMTQVLIKEEMGGYTYSVQFTSDSKEKLQNYFLKYEEDHLKEGKSLFENKFGTFTTVMKIVKEFNC